MSRVRLLTVPPTVAWSLRRVLAGSIWVITIALLTVTVEYKDVPSVEAVQDLGIVAGVFMTASMGVIVVVRGSVKMSGWLLLSFAVLLSVSGFADHLSASVSALSTARTAIAIGDVAFSLSMSSLLLLLLTIPTGRLPSRRWRPAAWLLGSASATWIAGALSTARRVVDLESWHARTSMVSTSGAALGPFEELLEGAGTALGWLVAASVFAALVVRLQSSSGENRQQVKWVVYGGVVAVVLLVLWLPQPQVDLAARMQPLLPGLAMLTLATGLGLALFKYRLWDVDLLVRRSLIYGTLWLAIAAVYAGVAAGLGLAAGARFPIEVAIALAVVAAVLFQPARRRLERAADRWVHGRKESPVEAMDTFSATIGSSDSSGDIASELAMTAMRGVGLGWVQVDISGTEPASVGALNDEPVIDIPVAWRDEEFGTLRCRPLRGGDLTTDDRALLRALASQAALAAAHVRLSARIVRAQEAERRRIERNIHDGAQQELAALIAEIGLARAEADDPASSSLLVEFQDSIGRILSNLRDLAQGIYPSVLRDGGLVAAMEDRCSRLPIDLSLEVAPALRSHRLPDEIEGAAYFMFAEGLSNVLKHSSADWVGVRASLECDQLRIEVSDNGIGFSLDAVTGTGLLGLRDRIDALRGNLDIHTAAGGGTRLVATLPVDSAPLGAS